MFFLYTLHVMISPENILSQKAALYSLMINPDYDIYHISLNKRLFKGGHLLTGRTYNLFV